MKPDGVAGKCTYQNLHYHKGNNMWILKRSDGKQVLQAPCLLSDKRVVFD